MDFKKFDEKKEAGKWVQLEIDGAKLFWDGEDVTDEETDKPIRVFLRSAASTAVYRAFQKYTAAVEAYNQRASRAKDKDLDRIASVHMNKTEDLLEDVIVAAVEDWENVHFAGVAEKPTPELVRDLIDRKSSPSKRALRFFLFSSIAEERDFLKDAAQD